MPPFRNPFNKRPPLANDSTPVNDENKRPSIAADSASQTSSYGGSRTSSSLSIKRREEPSEYKLSVVNDSGVYLPPSPTEKKSFWPRSTTSARNSNHRKMLNENEPFSISRESFESYRRSFDISARSPVLSQGSTPRQSIDSKASHPAQFAAKPEKFEPPQPRNEDDEGFEDVGLGDEIKQPRKKGIFSRFGDNSEAPTSGDAPRPTSSHRGFHLPGRKRGQSGQGSELGNIDRPLANGDEDGIVR